MRTQNVIIEEALLLRQKAEKLLKIKQTKTGLPFSEADTLKLIHELQVHEIELELTNEELLLANKKINDLAKEKYKELYDFAPSGYLTLSHEGEIIELNFVAADLLGKERSPLICKRFDSFVSANTRSTFNLFLQDIYSSNKKISCEVILNKEGNRPICVNIDGVADKVNDFYLLTLIDISERKQAELDLL
ncbi:PAS domain-containing protein, partial [Ancylomarina sp.]|uniref:PAS domain-containing protein n=1 Tax=Ancylomarina sp. TaxID=1970196 RepID=UPI003565CC0F